MDSISQSSQQVTIVDQIIVSGIAELFKDQSDPNLLAMSHQVLPQMILLDLRQNSYEELLMLCESFPTQAKEDFTRVYGDIMSLLRVEIKESLIRAMILYWDLAYRCFTFNNVDIVPMLEEYTTILQLLRGKKVYQFRSNKGMSSIIKEAMGKYEWVQSLITQRGADQMIEWERLKAKIYDARDIDLKKRLLALAVYGMVIFPKELGYINGHVLRFMSQLQRGINPVPTILAETIWSLSSCRLRGEGRFQGRLPLLNVWMKSHVRSKGGLSVCWYKRM